jgi:hypothetical protein
MALGHLLSRSYPIVQVFLTQIRPFYECETEISSAAKIFQNTPSSALEGLDGVRNISDDIMVFGRTQEEQIFWLLTKFRN